MADTEDVDTLKRRGRRRLVGAIALVLAAVIVLPMIFDQEPRQTPTTVNIRIPREDAGTFTPKIIPKPPAAAPTEPKGPDSSAAAARQPSASSGAAQEQGSAKPSEPTGTKSTSERARAEAALANVEFVVPVAAFSSRDRVKSLTRRLAAAKIPYYTEPVNTVSGRVTRVRAGPFGSRAAAERARARLERLGLKPGSVTQRSE